MGGAGIAPLVDCATNVGKKINSWGAVGCIQHPNQPSQCNPYQDFCMEVSCSNSGVFATQNQPGSCNGKTNGNGLLMPGQTTSPDTEGRAAPWRSQ